MIDCGLILEGGGMRGLYTAGVLDCLMDHDLYFRYIYGVSAGACHACSYVSRQRGRAVRTVTDFIGNKHYAGVYSFLKTGDFFGVQMIYDEIPNRLLPFDYDTYNKSSLFLCAVLTDCGSGKAAYFHVKNMRDDMRYIQASSSLPVLSTTVEIDGDRYLDGGVSDSIPLAKSIADGHRKNLVVLTQHKGYQKTPNKMMPIVKIKYHAYPALVESIGNRHNRYNTALDLVEEETAKGRAFVIQPQKPVLIGRLDKDVSKLNILYREGYEDTKSQLDNLKAFLGLQTRP
jgi:predicted patatin/cPLA2 family phospholipase